MAANFAFRTGNKKRKLFAYGRNLWFSRYSRIFYHVMPCYHMFTLIFAKRAQSKQQNTECSPVATTCKLVSIVECFRRRGVWKQVKVVQISMTKVDLFLGIFEAIPGTLKCFEDFLVCWEASVTLFALPWLDAFFSIIQSAWSTNSVTAEELSEHYKCKSFFIFQMKTTSYCVVFFQQIAGTVDRCFWTGQLEPFQRLTFFLTDSSHCSND